jgi:metal-responsive CopG/Arc/MetJ family transcriptional regulator
MVDTSERVTVRIPQELLEKLKQIQQAKETPTISDTIREGLEQYIELNLPPQNIRKVVVELSRQDNSRLEQFGPAARPHRREGEPVAAGGPPPP